MNDHQARDQAACYLTLAVRKKVRGYRQESTGYEQYEEIQIERALMKLEARVKKAISTWAAEADQQEA